jgi:hypothetical protein
VASSPIVTQTEDPGTDEDDCDSSTVYAFDDEDNSTGTLTAGTAITWKGNPETMDNRGGGLGN